MAAIVFFQNRPAQGPNKVIEWRLGLIQAKLEKPATKEEVLAILAGETDPPEPPSNEGPARGESQTSAGRPAINCNAVHIPAPTQSHSSPVTRWAHVGPTPPVAVPALLLLVTAIDPPPGLGSEIVAGPAAVIDGDTFRIGETVVRLFDIDAPELAQTAIAD